METDVKSQEDYIEQLEQMVVSQQESINHIMAARAQQLQDNRYLNQKISQLSIENMNLRDENMRLRRVNNTWARAHWQDALPSAAC